MPVSMEPVVEEEIEVIELEDSGERLVRVESVYSETSVPVGAPPASLPEFTPSTWKEYLQAAVQTIDRELNPLEQEALSHVKAEGVYSLSQALDSGISMETVLEMMVNAYRRRKNQQEQAERAELSVSDLNPTMQDLLEKELKRSLSQCELALCWQLTSKQVTTIQQRVTDQVGTLESFLEDMKRNRFGNRDGGVWKKRKATKISHLAAPVQDLLQGIDRELSPDELEMLSEVNPTGIRKLRAAVHSNGIDIEFCLDRMMEAFLRKKEEQQQQPPQHPFNAVGPSVEEVSSSPTRSTAVTSDASQSVNKERKPSLAGVGGPNCEVLKVWGSSDSIGRTLSDPDLLGTPVHDTNDENREEEDEEEYEIDPLRVSLSSLPCVESVGDSESEYTSGLSPLSGSPRSGYLFSPTSQQRTVA
eukprot:TRINITY_DN66956_c9_g3_i1.p1 TRINITY_DN66956_c9_g3~~TRINITY_DN66956_c9_g3_i1.p1  ORF type:complete len:417 (+),score=39.45 TRINITY_DN66956_c9_g3_i1:37-1287(+)